MLIVNCISLGCFTSLCLSFHTFRMRIMMILLRVKLKYSWPLNSGGLGAEGANPPRSWKIMLYFIVCPPHSQFHILGFNQHGSCCTVVLFAILKENLCMSGSVKIKPKFSKVYCTQKYCIWSIVSMSIGHTIKIFKVLIWKHRMKHYLLNDFYFSWFKKIPFQI